MARVDFIAAHSGPCYEFKYTAMRQDYTNIADFFGNITSTQLIEWGFDRSKIKKIMMKVIYEMYNSTVNITNLTKRFVIPMHDAITIIDIVEKSNTKNKAVIEFKQLLASFYPE